MSGTYIPNPPVRGPFGEADIWVDEKTAPVGLTAYRLRGVRGEAHVNLIRGYLEKRNRGEAHANLIKDYLEKKKMVPGVSGWNLPSFPVAKPNGKFRLVQDFGLLNEVTRKDAHPFPRIVDIVHRQGKNKI